MIFKRKARGGKHRGEPRKKSSTEATSPAPESTVVPVEPVGETFVSRLPVGSEARSEVKFIEAKAHSLSTLPELGSEVEEDNYDIPNDGAARKAYLLLLEAEASDDVFDSVAALLETRTAYLERLTSLNKQIKRLGEDSRVREAALDEWKMELHIKELSDENSEEELVYDSWEQHPFYTKNRDELDTAVKLIVRLENSRSALLQEYRPLMENILAILPFGVSPELEEELKETFHDDLKIFNEVHGGATDDEQHFEDADELVNIEEFLNELEKHSDGPLDASSGDSVFHLDK